MSRARICFLEGLPTITSIVEGFGSALNNINRPYCPRMLHIAECRCNPGMHYVGLQIIASNLVQHPGSNLYMYQSIDSIHNAFNT